MKRFFVALQFLTILPIRIKSDIADEDIGKSLIFFPLVGLIMGITLAFIASLFNFLPSMVTAAVILIASIIISGGLHLDGFSDTCDGLYANMPKEKTLQIMRDSHTGAMGVIGVTLLLIFKFALLASMPKEHMGKSLVLTMVFSRYSQVFACFFSNYARSEGKAKYFIEYATRRIFFIATAFTLLIYFVLIKAKGLILFNLCLALSLLFIIWIKRKIGGMTGDTIGAVSEIGEVSMLFFGLILL